MKENDKKDYMNIAEMSREFEKFMNSSIMTDKDIPVATKNCAILLWQASFQLAIAQQLSIVAKHLGKITAKAEQLNDQD